MTSSAHTNTNTCPPPTVPPPPQRLTEEAAPPPSPAHTCLRLTDEATAEAAAVARSCTHFASPQHSCRKLMDLPARRARHESAGPGMSQAGSCAMRLLDLPARRIWCASWLERKGGSWDAWME